MSSQDWKPYAEKLANDLEAMGCFKAGWQREAFFDTPRHLFIDRYYQLRDCDYVLVADLEPLTDARLKAIYSDDGLPIRQPPHHSASSQPSLIFQMLDDLELEPGNRVLEIGTGTGWNTALLARGSGDGRLIYSIDINPELIDAARRHLAAANVEGISLRAGDGGYGWPEAAPFDRIIVTVGSPDIPRHWTEQLADGGVLVVPLETGKIGNPVLRLRKENGQLRGGFTQYSGFYPMRGDFSLPKPEGSDERNALTQRLLASGERTELALPEPVPLNWQVRVQFPFFLYLVGAPFQTMNVCNSELVAHGMTVVFLDAESESALAAGGPEPVVWVYGDPASGERFVSRMEEWIALGKPGFSDYRVELVAPDARVRKQGQWIDRRQHATLKISLIGA